MDEKVLEELGEENMEDMLAIPTCMELDLIASQRQLYRNTAKQAQHMKDIHHAAKDEEGENGWKKILMRNVEIISQIDATFPDAKARMREMDDAMESVMKNQRAHGKRLAQV